MRQIRAFVTVAETLHFGRAAERLNLTQPPLSRQIAALERELGVRLLLRNSRQASLTRAGQRFLQDATATLACFDRACRNARLVDEGEMGELTLGFMMHAAYTVVPQITRLFTTAYPAVDVTLREMVPTSLIEDVVQGRCDVGILFPPGPVPGVEIRSIHSEKLCAAIHASHKLAERASIAVRDLAGEPLIMVPADVAPTLRTAIVDFCQRGGVAPIIRLEAQLQQTIVSLVAEKLGIALVPASLAKLGLPDVVFRDLQEAPIVEHVLAYRPDNPNPVLRRFLSMIDAHWPEEPLSFATDRLP